MPTLPQDSLDTQRRRTVQSIAAELRETVAVLSQEFGADQTKRVTDGLYMLLEESRDRTLEHIQRPALFSLPGLDMRPFYEPCAGTALGEFIKSLESNFTVILQDLSPLFASACSYIRGEYMRTKFAGAAGDDWTVVMLFSDRHWQVDVPTLRTLFRPFEPHLSGEVVISRLASQRTIPLHVDDNNYQLTLQLPLVVPFGDCGIRVGVEQRQYLPGRCILFSDSFLHEVWNRTGGYRDVLIIDLWHPGLSGIEIMCLGRIRTLLRTLGRKAAETSTK